MAFKHVTVLLNEAVEGLNIKPDGTYVDATLGGGGHSSLILSKLSSGHLYSFDQDETAIAYNQEHLGKYIADNHLTLIQDNFRNLRQALGVNGVSSFDGIVYDLGVSSPQFDDASRGFSYQHDAPLDMRMNQEQDLSARTVVNECPYERLVRIVYRIKQSIPARARRHGGHPAKRSFQAIRIAVNDELGALEESLEQALSMLNVNGRISVITFQSLEDRLVKTMFREKTSLPDLPAGLPVIPDNVQPDFRLVNKKPIEPSEAELTANHRAHSAKLRVIERIK